MSYIEIYNENIRDLLNPTAGPLELRDEGGNGPPVVAGLSEVLYFCLFRIDATILIPHLGTIRRPFLRRL